MLSRIRFRWLLLAVVVLAGPSSAAQLTVGAGSSLDLGSNRLDLGCADLAIAGTLRMSVATLEGARDVSGPGSLLAGLSVIRLAGDWTPGAGFATAGASVEIVDGCGRTTSKLLGDNIFGELHLLTSAGKRFELEAGKTQTIGWELDIQGEAGALAVVRSTSPGSAGSIDLAGGLAYANAVDVDDNFVVDGVVAVDETSIIGSNTSQWLFGPGVPALPASALLLGVALLFALARGRVLTQIARN